MPTQSWFVASIVLLYTLLGVYLSTRVSGSAVVLATLTYLMVSMAATASMTWFALYLRQLEARFPATITALFGCDLVLSALLALLVQFTGATDSLATRSLAAGGYDSSSQPRSFVTYDDGTGGIAACAVGRTIGTSCGTTSAGPRPSLLPLPDAPAGTGPISACGRANAGAVPRLKKSAVRTLKRNRHQRDIVSGFDAEQALTVSSSRAHAGWEAMPSRSQRGTRI